MKIKEKQLDIIMLSQLGRNDGGRETWLYNFLPELLKDKTISIVNLYGFKTKDINKNYDELLAIDKRIKPIFFHLKKSKKPLFVSMFFKLKKHIKTKKHSDITLAMGVFELFMMFNIKGFKKSKKVVWLRSIFSNEKAYVIPKLLRTIILKIEIYLLKKADIIISNGDDIKEFYEKHGLNVNVIKNGVDIDKWKQEPPKLINSINIAYIGRLSKVKGIQSYINVIKMIKKNDLDNNFTFHVVGNEDTYKNQIDSLVSKGYVKRHGIVANRELPKFLNKIDVCVALTFASKNGGGGGTSNAMLEQMAASKIMLAWDNEIFRQYLNSSNAYLVKQYDINALKEALLEIKNNKTKALNKSNEAYKTITPYTFKENVEQFKKLVFNL